MSTSEAYDLDALVEEARAAKPRPVRSIDARRMVRSAVEQALSSRKVRVRRYAFACAAALLLGFLAAGHALFSERVTTVEVGRGDRPLRLALRSGDTLVAAPHTELEILTQELEKRAVRVTHGSALFDVRALRDGERFEVETAHASLRVLGTVFAVEVENGRTIVRVYEGRVFVAGRVVQAGGVWASAGEAPKLGGEVLALEAAEAVALRKPRAGALAANPPTVIAVSLPQKASGAATPNVQVPAPAPSPATNTPEAARALLGQGQAEAALALAEAHANESNADWHLLAADAQQALGRFAAAAQRYEQAAQALSGAPREQAALSAVTLTLHQAHDPTRALALLDAFALDDDRASVRERASVLRIDALLALGHREAARVHALRYLGREPDTQTSARMRRLLD
jgi:hypothetical protein